MDGLTIRQRYDQLVSQRYNLDTTFDLIQKFIVPYRGDFFKPGTSEHEVEWRRRFIYDSTAPIAADLLASKIHTNLTSPTIRWFQLRFRDDDVNDNVEAKEWLEAVQNQIWQTLLESDFSMEISETYLDLTSFGTAMLFEEELDEETWEGVTFTALPVRESYFELGADERVLRFYRGLRLTRLQLEDKFPDYEFNWEEKKGSNDEDEKAKDVDARELVIFCVYNRPDVEQDPEGTVAPLARPYGYKYVLHKDGETLDEGGYYDMPAFIPRWKKVSGSHWGHSPGFVALSDILQLNEVVSQLSEARAKEIDPPMKTTERGILSDLDLLPGGLTMVMDMNELDRLSPPNAGGLFQGDMEIERLQNSIKSTFFVDRLELKESPAMTATEVLARLQQMMEQFAPTLGRLQADLLDPLIEYTYRLLGRRGLLPEVPESISELELDIEYTGPIPRAQKNEQAQSVSQWVGELAGLSQISPEFMDVVDTDAIARELGFDRGVPAKLMRTQSEVKDIRTERNEQQKAMAAAAAAKDISQASKNVSDAGAA